MKIESKKQKILIVADSHTDWKRLDKIIKAESADIVIDLGDHFDSHAEVGIGVKENRKMALWLKGQLKQSNYFSLMGNHDNHYRFTNRFCRCTGFSEAKNLEINSILTQEDWVKHLDFIVVDDFLLTHAGVNAYYIPNDIHNMDNINSWMAIESQDRHRMRANGKKHWFYNCGPFRHGYDRVSGIYWQDDDEFKTPTWLKQIFGHSFQRDFNIRKYDNGSMCIDTRLNKYITITNGELKINNYLDL